MKNVAALLTTMLVTIPSGLVAQTDAPVPAATPPQRILRAEIDINRQLPLPRTGREFQQALQRPVVGWSWQAIELRAALLEILQTQQIAIMLDRGVNPNHVLSLQIESSTLLEALQQLAADADAECRVMEDLVYFAPPAAAERLRTMVALRRAELMQADVDRGRLRQTLTRQTLQWPDLTTPADVLAEIARRWQLRIAGQERVPHDLWPAACLPQVNAVEALALVLNGFQLTYEWSPSGDTLTVVPCPERLSLTKRYAVASGREAATARDWQSQCPGLQIQQAQNALIVEGTLEQHEQIQGKTSGVRRPDRSNDPARTPLAQRRFTLTAKSVAVTDLMSNLQTSGIQFQYDADALADAGIDLGKRVDIDLQNATAEELFQAMFGSLGIRFSVRGLTVELRPTR